MVHINHKSCPLILQLKKNSLLVFITPTLMHSMHTKATKNQHGDMEITTSVNKVEGMVECWTIVHTKQKITWECLEIQTIKQRK